MGKNDDFDSIYDVRKLDMADIIVNGCFDEEGNEATCDWCSSQLFWRDGIYICPECEQEVSRADFFNSIGADPPDAKCITCYDNYPVCKKWCMEVEISPDDEFYF